MRRIASNRLGLGPALGLVAGLGLAASGPALAQSDAAALPAFPPRVVAGPPYNGGQEVIFDALMAPFHPLLRNHGGDLSLVQLLRHRSLRLSDHGGAGLIDALLSDAEAKGWTAVPDLTVSGSVLFQALGLERDGRLVFVLAFGDAVTPRADNPGASLAIADEATTCAEDAGVPEPGLAPCPVEGFVPVWVWTDLPQDAAAEGAWLDPDAPVLPDDADAVWGEPATWDEVLARGTGD